MSPYYASLNKTISPFPMNTSPERSASTPLKRGIRKILPILFILSPISSHAADEWKLHPDAAEKPNVPHGDKIFRRKVQAQRATK